MNPEIKKFQSKDEMFEAAALAFIKAAKKRIARSGFFTVALSGGKTPDGLFSKLAEYDFAEWSRVAFFWVDERCVPPDSPDSNFGRARELLLTKLSINPENIYRIEAEKPTAVEDYIHILTSGILPVNSKGAPVFDLILLGMGADGHTASLFPGSPALQEKEQIVVRIPGSEDLQFGLDRITLTLPVINSAGQIFVIITGREKMDLLQCILNQKVSSYPVGMVAPRIMPPLWFISY
ncbi:MAG: 6-phosphogluconolactonase [Victivallaceae bacterium]